MYQGGGGAGVGYDSYQVSTGAPFRGRDSYASTAACISRSQACKVHYRDAALAFAETDYGAVVAKVAAAMDRAAA